MKKRHLLFIDPLDKLSIKKDSTLMFALTLKERGEEAYLLFESDFYFTNTESAQHVVYDFQGTFSKDSYYLDYFRRESQKTVTIGANDIIHMRIDPPFDSRYLRYLWMLQSIQKQSNVSIMNAPEGILLHNEKLYAYGLENSPQSFVGTGRNDFTTFYKTIKDKGFQNLIIKPLDLFQGIGVEKISLLRSQSEIEEIFEKKVKEFSGPIIAQPYIAAVESGEVRSMFFKGKELGSILKIPPKGEYLANIAQGATYHACELNDKQKKICTQVSQELSTFGIDWIAFDLLGDYLSEVNITCPGLLVEISQAHQRNLAIDIVDLMK